MVDLTGKIAFVTGAGGYIGSETARVLARQGAKIAACDKNEEALKKTVSSIVEAGGEAKGYLLDVTDSNAVNAVVKKVVEDFGGVDISVHVAGGSARLAGPNAYASLINQRDEVIDTVLKINLYGAMYVARACAKVMKEQGRGGRIVSFSSIVGVNGLKVCSEYAAAKAGVVGFTKCLCKELGPDKITVNAISPGVVMRPEEEGGEERALHTNFLQRKCLATDVAELVAFIVSDEAGFITGQNYIIDGGRSLAMKGTD